MRYRTILGPIVTTLALAVSAAGCATEESSLEEASSAAPIQADFITNGLGDVKNWTYAFAVLDSTGTRTPLYDQRASEAVYGASTFKLATGWVAFKKRGQDEDVLDGLAKMLHRSDNDRADTSMSKNGGVRANTQWLRDNGVNLSKNFRQINGSGLGLGTLTANDLIELLTAIRKDPGYERFKELLAQPGESGTLGSRFPNLPDNTLFGKTGTLPNTGVKNLTGFVELPGGRTLLFAVLGSGMSGRTDSAGYRIDSVVSQVIDRLQ